MVSESKKLFNVTFFEKKIVNTYRAASSEADEYGFVRNEMYIIANDESDAVAKFSDVKKDCILKRIDRLASVDVNEYEKLLII